MEMCAFGDRKAEYSAYSWAMFDSSEKMNNLIRRTKTPTLDYKIRNNRKVEGSGLPISMGHCCPPTKTYYSPIPLISSCFASSFSFWNMATICTECDIQHFEKKKNKNV